MVHKLILASRSARFNSMLYSDSSTSNGIRINDFQIDTVKLALEFIYDRNIFDNLHVVEAFEMIRFAEKFRMLDLKDKLETFISYRLTPSNVCHFFNSSVTSNSATLRQLFYDFLMVCSKHTINVDDLELLENELPVEFYRKTFNLTALYHD
uniref:BTB domain-containing protein n=1 Tax=Panagrolaimus sp. PS1159 TaxID=55785 RepID=A0AC35FKT4_9BILA